MSHLRRKLALASVSIALALLSIVTPRAYAADSPVTIGVTLSATGPGSGASPGIREKQTTRMLPLTLMTLMTLMTSMTLGTVRWSLSEVPNGS